MPINPEKLLADQRVSEWFARERARNQREKEAQNVKTPIITISRQYGSLGDETAKLLKNMLGSNWDIWDKELISAIAEQASVREQMVEAVEQHKSHFEKVIEQAFGIQTLDDGSYRVALARVLLAIANQGKKIIIGRGANYILTSALNVCIKGSLEFRANNIMVERQIGRAQAVSEIRDKDKERLEFIRHVYQRNADEDKGYDLVIYTDNIGAGGAACAIASAAKALYKDCI